MNQQYLWFKCVTITRKEQSLSIILFLIFFNIGNFLSIHRIFSPKIVFWILSTCLNVACTFAIYFDTWVFNTELRFLCMYAEVMWRQQISQIVYIGRCLLTHSMCSCSPNGRISYRISLDSIYFVDKWTRANYPISSELKTSKIFLFHSMFCLFWI